MDRELNVQITTEYGAVSVEITDKESGVEPYEIWIPKMDIENEYYAMEIGKEIMSWVRVAFDNEEV